MQMFTSPIVSQRWKPRMELKPSKFSYDNYVTVCLGCLWKGQPWMGKRVTEMGREKSQNRRQ